MTEDEITKLFTEELKKLRADYFRGKMALTTRIPADYAEQPELLTLDFAWAVTTALCAAAVAGIDLDVNAAVEAGKALYKRQFS